MIGGRSGDAGEGFLDGDDAAQVGDDAERPRSGMDEAEEAEVREVEEVEEESLAWSSRTSWTRSSRGRASSSARVHERDDVMSVSGLEAQGEHGAVGENWEFYRGELGSG